MTPDYIFKDSTAFKEEISNIIKKTGELKLERKNAMRSNAGLDGPIGAVNEEIILLEDEIKKLETRVRIIEQGFPFFEKYGFQAAIEACAMLDYWEPLAEDFDGLIFGFKDTKIRLPLSVQERYLAATKLHVFVSFQICYTFETADDEDAGLPTTYYYLFGSPPNEENSDLFLIADWSFEPTYG